MFESFVINKILYISIFGNNRASLEFIDDLMNFF